MDGSCPRQTEPRPSIGAPTGRSCKRRDHGCAARSVPANGCHQRCCQDDHDAHARPRVCRPACSHPTIVVDCLPIARHAACGPAGSFQAGESDAGTIQRAVGGHRSPGAAAAAAAGVHQVGRGGTQAHPDGADHAGRRPRAGRIARHPGPDRPQDRGAGVSHHQQRGVARGHSYRRVGQGRRPGPRHRRQARPGQEARRPAAAPAGAVGADAGGVPPARRGAVPAGVGRVAVAGQLPRGDRRRAGG